MIALTIGISILVAIVAAAAYGRGGTGEQERVAARRTAEVRNLHAVHPGNLVPVPVPMPSLN